MQATESIVAVLRDTVSLEDAENGQMSLALKPCRAPRQLLLPTVRAFTSMAKMHSLRLTGWCDGIGLASNAGSALPLDVLASMLGPGVVGKPG